MGWLENSRIPILDISAHSAYRTRRASKNAAAIPVAMASSVGSGFAPAIAWASFMVCSWKARSEIALTLKPCLRALRQEHALPAAVFGPLLLRPFLRLASRCRMVLDLTGDLSSDEAAEAV
ncbi:MAG TPA: hypothetical protein VIH98_02615 [Xanthobacteraceae bacterium]